MSTRWWCAALVVVLLRAGWGDAAVVRRLRVGAEADKVRLVFDLAAPLQHQVRADEGLLEVTLDGAADEAMADRIETGDPIVPLVELAERGPRTVVRIHRRGLPPFNAFTLGSPARLVIDIQKTYQTEEEGQPAEGVLWRRWVEGNPQGFRAANLLRCRWTASHLRVTPLLAGEVLQQRATVRRMAERAGAIAAINGGDFAPDGLPLGWLVLDHQWVRIAAWPRTALAWWAREGRYEMDQLMTIATAHFERGQRLEVFALNSVPQETDELALFTSRWGEETPALPDFMGLTVEEGRITDASGWGETAAIPVRGGALLLNRRVLPRLHHDIRIGDRLELVFRTRPDWGSVEQALGAGPHLVRAGKLFLTAEIERFEEDFAAATVPRAAVGFARDGDMLWATVDGDGPRRGLTLKDWAGWLIAHGAWDAMNLDGGDSTTLVVDGRVKSFPPGGVEPQVGNALALISSRTE